MIVAYQKLMVKYLTNLQQLLCFLKPKKKLSLRTYLIKSQKIPTKVNIKYPFILGLG